MITEAKNLLLLGGSSDQVFAIKTAKAMGLYVIVVDGNPDSPGFSMADKYAVVSTRDLPALKAFVDGLIFPIHGVAVMGSDISQYVSALAEYLSVPCIPLRAAEIATNKLLMKQCFANNGIAIPWFSAVNSFEHLCQLVVERGFPLVLKPVDRSGARGVFLLKKGADLDVLYQSSLEESFSGQLIIEEYLEGPQISTETLFYQGKGHTVGFVDRNYEMLDVFAPYILENGGWQPSRLSQQQRSDIEQLIDDVAKALDIESGVIKGDIVFTPSGPKVIEVATRLSGGDFSESLVPLGLGVNYVQTALEIALDIEPNFDALIPKQNQFVANRYFFPEEGKLTAIHGIEKVRSHDFVKKLEFFVNVGEIVRPICSHADRAGVFIVVADSFEELEMRIAWVYKTILFEVC
ncbi:ATP-grasp domain-containing protein [Shewanella sp. GD03713]|uniref:ATP-grasp domain-containing protein n=1 Tax=Shewanella sp. GD03713 TaxID=2975372 RepID=UPI000B344531|nr:ATP-grasp domain-containing protein [Shewanella sp. GD03713]MDH1469609.1 ATP-grasp domain-containing protein [Shewanella sp. GD03713]QXN23859.1 ATP-grasp domain-containing protein [Shewanella putrefaciens]